MVVITSRSEMNPMTVEQSREFFTLVNFLLLVILFYFISSAFLPPRSTKQPATTHEPPLVLGGRGWKGNQRPEKRKSKTSGTRRLRSPICKLLGRGVILFRWEWSYEGPSAKNKPPTYHPKQSQRPRAHHEGGKQAPEKATTPPKKARPAVEGSVSPFAI